MILQKFFLINPNPIELPEDLVPENPFDGGF